jgi:hypothetical protein
MLFSAISASGNSPSVISFYRFLFRFSFVRALVAKRIIHAVGLFGFAACLAAATYYLVRYALSLPPLALS